MTFRVRTGLVFLWLFCLPHLVVGDSLQWEKSSVHLHINAPRVQNKGITLFLSEKIVVRFFTQEKSLKIEISEWDNLKGVWRVSRKPLTSLEEGKPWEQTFVIKPSLTGMQTLSFPSIKIQKSPDEEEIIRFPDLKVVVKTKVFQARAEDFREAIDLEKVAQDASETQWLSVFVVLMGVTLTSVSVVLLWTFWNWSSKKEPQDEEQQALQALSQLTIRSPQTRQEMADAFSHMATIIRKYLEGKWQVSLQSKTSDEVSRVLKEKNRLPSESRAFLRKFFADCVLIQFAPVVPSPALFQETLEKLNSFLETQRVER